MCRLWTMKPVSTPTSAARCGHPGGVGVTAEPSVPLVQRHMMVLCQHVGGGQPRHPAADDRHLQHEAKAIERADRPPQPRAMAAILRRASGVGASRPNTAASRASKATRAASAASSSTAAGGRHDGRSRHDVADPDRGREDADGPARRSGIVELSVAGDRPRCDDGRDSVQQRQQPDQPRNQITGRSSQLAPPKARTRFRPPRQRAQAQQPQHCVARQPVPERRAFEHRMARAAI